MKKIAAFIFDLSKGGAQGVFVNVVNYLHSNNYAVEVVVQSLEGAIYRDDLAKDIRVTDIGVAATKELFPHLKKYVEKHDFDCAIAFSPEIAVTLYLVKKFLKKNFVIVGRCINTLSYEYSHVNSFFRKYITHTLLKMYYHKIDYVIAQSVGMEEDLIKNYGFANSQVFTINNAVAPAFEAEIDSDCTENSNNSYILYAGRLEKQKGLEMLLEAFSELTHKNIPLYLVGSGSLKAQLIEQAKRLNISKDIVFVEHTREIAEYYKKAKLTVLSSYFEGFPNVLVESIACGTPVVAYDLPSGPKEIIIDGLNGYLVDYLNVAALRQAIDKALDTNWDIAEIKESAKRFKAEIIMAKYTAMLEKILD